MPTHFGDFTLDESRRLVLRGVEPLHLSPKAFQLLSILIQESPKAVSKNELQERLWPETFVTEGSLANLVAELRSALGDDPKEPRYIRTLYGFGYAFAAPIAEATAAPKPPKQVRWGHLTAAALIAAVGIVVLLSLRSSVAPVQTSAPIRSIAVLPFDTSGTDRADEHLGLGLPDLLITRLSNVRHLTVRPTSAIREYAGQHADSRDAGHKLKVDGVLEGSIRTTPDRVRVTVQLLNVHQQKPIWAEQFDQKRSEMFALEDDISARVAEALMMRLTPNEKGLLAKRYTANPDAYDLYMQGRYELERSVREGVLEHRLKAAQLFEQAASKDPSYALAWAGVAQAYAIAQAQQRVPLRIAFEKATAAARKALQLDPDLSEAHAAAGTIKMFWELDYAGAEREFRRALELNPRNTAALTGYAYLLQCLRRFDESIAVREREIEIDPMNAGVQWGLANAYLTARQDERGIRQAQVVLSMEPNYPEVYVALTRIYTLRGQYEKAIAYGQKLVQMNPSNPRALAFFGYALGKAGRKAEANRILEQLKKNERTPPFLIAVVHLGLGDREAVFPLLEKGLSDRTYAIRLNTEPVLDPLRSDPRFVALLQRAGFKG
jgi:TolB-like protein/DNA-binding winged helix-turn-helix (wHTH) protein/Tfp pilus assembly protein PilF